MKGDRWRLPFVAAALVVLAAALPGCGSGGSGQASSSGVPKHETEAAIKAARRVGKLAETGRGRAPKGASSVLRELYRQFGAPKPSAEVPGSAGAISAGETACAGKTPIQVKDTFYRDAVSRGSLDQGSPEGRLVAKLGRYEARKTDDPSFIAGQLAADVYQATLPERVGQFGFQGCVHALAKRVERELAPGAH